MRRYSPSSLSVFERCCPAALEMYFKARAEDADGDGAWDAEGPEMADIGIAFHAIVHAAALARRDGQGAFGPMKATATALAGRMPPDRA